MELHTEHQSLLAAIVPAGCGQSTLTHSYIAGTEISQNTSVHYKSYRNNNSNNNNN
jgi:ABC-type nitrate/sulfonate/bicarbonate transport system ATPase subunit